MVILMQTICRLAAVLLTCFFASQAIGVETIKPKADPNKVPASTTTDSFPTKRNIITTYFWIGQGGTSISSTTNIKSAWDEFWKKNFGGIDCPEDRKDAKKFREASLPEKFAPTLNPFYVALPFNDIAFPKKARAFVPWWSEKELIIDHLESQCKGRLVMI